MEIHAVECFLTKSKDSSTAKEKRGRLCVNCCFLAEPNPWRLRILGRQSLKREYRGRNHVAQRIKEKRMRLATIKSERHFVQVGREMLWTDAVPRSNDAALEQRERRLDGVGRDHEAVLVTDVLFCLVIYGLALRYLALGKSRLVKHGFVGHDHVY